MRIGAIGIAVGEGAGGNLRRTHRNIGEDGLAIHAILELERVDLVVAKTRVQRFVVRNGLVWADDLIREALQRLAVDGWGELRPAYGAYVHIPTTEEVAQLLGVRSVLEAYSAREAAQHATKERMARVRELYAAGMAALAADDESGLVVANADLHAYIMQMSGNKVLAELISQVERRVRWYYTPIARPRGKEAWHEHDGLIEAIAAGDADLAERMMRAHTERTTDFYRKEFVPANRTSAG